MLAPVYEVTNVEKVLSIINKHYNQLNGVARLGYQFNIPTTIAVKNGLLLVDPHYTQGNYYLIRYLKNRKLIRLKYFLDYKTMKVISVNSQLGDLLYRVMKLIENNKLISVKALKTTTDKLPSTVTSYNITVKPIVVGINLRDTENTSDGVLMSIDVKMANSVPSDMLNPTEIGDDVIRLPLSVAEDLYNLRVLKPSKSKGLILLEYNSGYPPFDKLFVNSLATMIVKRDRYYSYSNLTDNPRTIWNNVKLPIDEKLYSLIHILFESTWKVPGSLDFNKRGELTLTIDGIRINLDKLHSKVRLFRELVLTPSNKITSAVLSELGVNSMKVVNAITYNTPQGEVPLYFELPELKKVFMHSDLLNLLVISEFTGLIHDKSVEPKLLDVGATLEKAFPVVGKQFKFSADMREVFNPAPSIRFKVVPQEGVITFGIHHSTLHATTKHNVFGINM